VKVLADLLSELQKKNGAKPVDLRVAAFALFGMMNWIYTWYQPRRDLPFSQLIEQMLRVYFFGLLESGAVEEEWFHAPSKNSKGAFSLWQSIA
jgi:hypothetical protein